MAIVYSILGIVLIGGGVMLMMHGRTLPTWQEEEEHQLSKGFLYELIFGPPGYGRARGLFGGVVLILMGILAVAFYFTER